MRKNLHPSLLPELRRYETIAGWIMELTGEREPVVRRRLREEYEHPGKNVARALREAGVEPFVWSEGMARFYEETDAFLYELSLWNRNPAKGAMRASVAAQLPGVGRPLDILTIGDGLGFDSAFLASLGHHVTYSEVSGYAERFARHVFAEAGVDVRVLAGVGEIPADAFDAVVCLDVLEHVPDPPELVRTLVGYLRPAGRLIVTAPFWMIHPDAPTHLKRNRAYSGSLSLYNRCGLNLVDGRIGWNPMSFQKTAHGTKGSSALRPKRLALRLAGLVMLLGRFPVLPLFLAAPFVRKSSRWFPEC